MNGTVRAPPSKSYTHRAIVCGLLSSEETRISNPLFCEDTEASIRLSKMMGAQISNNDTLTISGPKQLIAPSVDMDCGGSGTTLRIFTSLSSLTSGKCILTGDQSLQARPMTELLQALQQLGVEAISIRGNGNPPIEILGQGLRGGNVRIRGDISSQYISGLLLACSRAENDTRIEISTTLESRPYVEMTLEVMQHFGVTARPTKEWNEIAIEGKQTYSASDFDVPGDYSSAAFLLVAGALNGEIRISGLDQRSIQGDSQITSLMQKMGVSIEQSNEGYIVNRSEPSAMDIDVSNTPDLVPILAVMASQANGTTRIFNAERLRFKESDRLMTITVELRKMGAQIDITKDGITIEGPTPLRGAVIESHHDHRIAMACTVAGIIAEGPTLIEGAECIAKSYPEFIAHMQSIGADIELEQKTKEGGF